MPDLNATTVILLNGVVAALMYLALRAIRRALPGETHAIDAWAQGYACFALSALLFLSRGELSPLLSIIIPCTLLSYGMVLLCQGFYRFRGRDFSRTLMFGLAVALFLAYATVTYLMPSYLIRVLLIALSGVLTHGAILKLYVTQQDRHWRLGERLTIFAIVCAFLAYLVRLAGLFSVEMDHAASLSAVGTGPLFFTHLVLLNLAQILLANGLFVLTQEHIAEDLRHTVSHDALTGALSRSAILDRLDDARDSVARNGDRWAVIMLDLDHFKVINDRGGHAAGDEMLRAVVSAVANTLRRDSYLGRFGGEEFLVVARIRAPGEGERLAERIREAVESLVITTEAGPLRCTLSAGVDEFDPADPGLGEELLRRADQALYGAKRAGRNSVRSACDSAATAARTAL